MHILVHPQRSGAVIAAAVEYRDIKKGLQQTGRINRKQALPIQNEHRKQDAHGNCNKTSDVMKGMLRYVQQSVELRFQIVSDTVKPRSVEETGSNGCNIWCCFVILQLGRSIQIYQVAEQSKVSSPDL